MTGGEDDGAFLEALTDSALYSIGAHFTDRNPELVDDVLAQSEAIENAGLAAWAAREDVTLEVAFQTLVTGLAVRYFKAVAGAG
ncbi:MAG: hypothetical protein QOH72_290 [Solirubrobacteraceae bacterium]|nr:hypothetical protein [Solirubrobacteraceae bacterium]